MRDIDFTPQANYILGKGGKGVPFPDQNLPGYQVTGFAPDYTNYDTIPKTPAWAEQICGVPADTITALAHLLASNKPGILMRHYGVTRKSYGDYTLKMAMWIQIILGNAPGVHGGFASNGTSTKSSNIGLGSYLQRAIVGIQYRKYIHCSDVLSCLPLVEGRKLRS